MKKIFNGKYYLIATAVVQCLFWGSLFASSLLHDGFFGFLGDMGEIVFLLFLLLIFLFVPLGILVFFLTESDKKYAVIGFLLNLGVIVFSVFAYSAIVPVPMRGF